MPVYLRIYVATILPSVSFAILCVLASIHKTGLELIPVMLFIYWALYMIIIGAPLQTLILGYIYKRYKERADDYYSFIKLFVIGIFYSLISAPFSSIFYSSPGLFTVLLAVLGPLIIEMVVILLLPRVFSSEHFLNPED